jgi:hypothetical protein
MDRREVMKTLGVTATGFIAGQVAGSQQAQADEHGEQHGPMPPIENVHLYFCGFHIAKNNPKFQIETQHYCAVRGEGMHQCILYDKNDKTAKLLGVEYIITDKLYQGLPEDEKRFWHPHTYEVLGGQLIAPNMDQKGGRRVHESPYHHMGQSSSCVARPIHRNPNWRSPSDVVDYGRRTN